MEAANQIRPSPGALSRLRRLEAQFLKPYRGTIVLALAGMLLQSVLLVPIPLLQGWVLDRLVEARGGAASPAQAAALQTILVVLAVSIACYLARMGLAWKVAQTMSRVGLEVVRDLTDVLHRKFQRLPMAYFDREQTGRMMSRITNDVGSLLVFLSSGSLQLVSDLVLAVGISATLTWLNWRLALLSFATIPFYALNHRVFASRIRELSRQIRAHIATIYALISERVSAVRVVRAFAQEGAEIAEFDRRIDTHRLLNWTNMRTGSLQGALATLISGLGTVAVLLYGVRLVGGGQLSVGELLAFYALIPQLYTPIVRLTQFNITFATTQVAVDRVTEVLDEPETLTDRAHARPIRQARGELVFRKVSFAYRPDGPRVLDHIHLRIEPGMTVGVLGASGAGKSTLLALAPRLYDVPDGCGTVLLDGRDVRDLRLADLRRLVMLVPQQAMLFEGTIRSNLTYARPEASASAIRRALAAADLADTVAGFPFGLETPVGERGFSLSGGQRQRLALARALIADPAVLLLDDCTSALDAETEARIQCALQDSLPGRTRIIVSHKVSAVRHADLIVVLESGRVIEQGDHEELIARDGAYAEVFDQQTGALAF
ncbi:MAG TPA: ABC transporter ATP-binding protein [Gemmataceae bacterium]|nr:ABC transporter ATP-binding protein [Gemmataceae bacterium]